MLKRPRSGSDIVKSPAKRLRSEPLNLTSLPDEVLVKILSDLPASSISICQRLSRKFNELALDSHIWKRKYYDRWVLPRALRIPGLRDPSANPRNLSASSKLSKWLNDDHLVRRGRETDWRQQYRLRHNWSKGKCEVNEMEVAQPPNPPLLVRLYQGIIVTVGLVQGLKAYSMKDKCALIAEALPLTERGQHWDSPTTIALGHGFSDVDGQLSVVVGFSDGLFDIYSLLPDEGRFKLRYSQAPKTAPKSPRMESGGNEDFDHEELNNEAPGFGSADIEPTYPVTSVAFAQSYVATLRNNKAFSIYKFDRADNSSELGDLLEPPRQLSDLVAQNVGRMVSLSLRASSEGVIASIAYTARSLLNPCVLALQELRFNDAGRTLQSRLAYAAPENLPLSLNLERALLRPSTIVASCVHSPVLRTISYSHPYLLVVSPDNTMAVYLVNSTPDTLVFQAGHRLWGHTADIGSAEVSDRGKAVSVTHLGDEMRIWELEDMMTNSRRSSKRRASTKVRPAGILVETEKEKLSLSSKTIDTRGSCPHHGMMDEMSRWVGFDDEHLVVLRVKEPRLPGTQMLSCYDFR